MITHETPTSSNIAKLQYDPDTAELRVEFRSNKTYVYDGVSMDIWNDFITAPSAGRYFNQNISGFYKEKKV